MKWNQPNQLVLGQTRTKTKFLIFPKLLQGEWRWLSVETWSQTVCGVAVYPVAEVQAPPGLYSLEWLSKEWVDNALEN